MSRPQELNEPIRVNYVIERRQDKALRELAYNTNRNLSELVRMAIDTFLENDYTKLEKPVKGDIYNILVLLDYMILKMRPSENTSEWELKRADLSMMFGSQWWKIKAVIDMTIAAMNAKGIDAMQEEIVIAIEVPGTNRMKHEKFGFRIVVPASIDRELLKSVRDKIELDAKRFGCIMIDITTVDGTDDEE